MTVKDVLEILESVPEDTRLEFTYFSEDTPGKRKKCVIHDFVKYFKGGEERRSNGTAIFLVDRVCIELVGRNK